ncbi:hypothetical protein SAMN05444000_111118 [Shimia gijangensis]|uniref:Uncharacterized protein n=1 Tax=Shimia gijangensis TaxID=1470563 RepID=A0A1M6L942_9RHOB|nr:hypothetical protein [Shimia gijangensis]SHJ67685.1 hypothetical protein SAMN05444000_111118 [Shimia gijangensis]
MRKFIGVLIGLSLIEFGVIAFVGQSNVAQRNGNVEDFTDVNATLWAATMTTLSNDDDAWIWTEPH